MSNNLPISTQWTLNATAALPSQVFMSVVLIATTSTGQKGTGWLASNLHIVTNEHVVRGGMANNIVVQFSDGNIARVQHVEVDPLTDIAVLTLQQAVSYAPLKIDVAVPDIGSRVCAWGHPLGYNGPQPILTVGYFAGFNAHQPPGMAAPQCRLVLNAALNPGNSGGPIFNWGENSVRGVAVTKHAPITPYLQSAIDALKNNKSGVTFTATDGSGNSQTFVESQIVAEVLQYFRSMTQVVLGEAIIATDVTAFLTQHSVPWLPA